ncbi:MAG: PA14 domain-containing protein [Janthinobacterium lividum]
MNKYVMTRRLLALLVSYLLAFSVQGQASAEERIAITTITPSLNTGQDYSPWLDDNLNNLVQNSWQSNNFQYVDVTLKLAKTTVLSRLSLFDYQGIFSAQPALIYAQNGTQRTLIGSFDGSLYNVWVDLAVSGSVTADAIVIHKYSNNIPVKIKVFGRTGTTTTPTTPVAVASVLTFGTLASKTVGDAPFALAASSTNAVTAIVFSSSNPAVVSVAQTSAGTWQATVVGAGTATITAAQAAGNGYLAAASVGQPVAVQAAPVVVVVTPTPTTPTGATTTGKIPIDGSRWYQLTNAANTITPLFDGSTATGSTITWGKIIPTYDSYYALQPGETINLQSIKFYDGAGTNPSDPMTLSVITDAWQRIPVATFTGSQYNTWVGPDPSQPANFNLPTALSNIRYLVLTASFAYPNEIELYGTYTAGTALAATDVAALAVQKQIKLGQEFGVNGFEWDVEDPNAPGTVDATRLTAVKNFTGFRHYLDWQKLESTQGGYTFNPVHSGGWNYDAMYTSLKANGVTVLACLKTLPDWLLATYPGSDREAENVPVAYGQDFSSPNSYLAQAKVAFQYAARYGANPNVTASLVTVDQSTRWAGDGVNQVKIGLNLVHYIECDNERDKWWKGRKAYQTGREYAANMSAFYDGNKNTMGAGVGVKNADPTMQVVMAGLANPSPDYVRGMIDWCRQFRGYKADGSVNLCWDVINYHYYSNNAGSSQGGNATRGSAPEVVTTAQVAQDFIKVAHQYAADMPVWVTEAGYDLNQGSPLKAIAIGNRTVAQTQADWTLRTALLYARWGVERTFFYMLSDDNANSAVQFSSSGLINSDRSARPVADFLRQANQLLGAYVYTGTLNADPIVDRYQLGSKTAYALVVPDETGRTASYTLSLGTDSATIYRPREGATMQVTRVRTQNGQLTLTVTETPQFVVAGNSAATTTPTTTACTGTGSIGWEQWTNVYGQAIASIPTATTPTNTATLTSLQSALNIGDNYGARIRGYVCAPQTGSYTFEIAGDDDCELWLSTDDTPANKIRIAQVSGWTNPGEWTKYASQQSAAVTLQAGTRYYIEVLHHEINGGDFVAVGWKLPNGQTEAPIAGSHLMPYTTASAKTAARGTASALASTPVADALTQPALLVYPNPFSSEASLNFTLPAAGTATLELYDLQSRLVRRLYSGSVEAGQARQVSLDGAGLSAGIYLVRLVTGSTVLTQKLVKAE